MSRGRMLACPWKLSTGDGHPEQLTQAIGRAAAAAGFEGLLVDSALSDVTNLVIFPEFLSPPSNLATINADELRD